MARQRDSTRALLKTPEGRADLATAGRLWDLIKRTEHGRIVAWDGEAHTEPDGSHHYFLLKNSDGAALRDYHLATRPILQFLLDNADPACTHVIYFGGYDVTQWLRDLPPSIIQTVVKTNDNTRIVYESGARYVIRYFPNKWFTISGLTSGGGWKEITIYDVGSFFQMSAIKAWHSRGIEVPEIIETGKGARSSFSWEDADEVEAYCTIELALYVKLVETLLDEFAMAGVSLKRLHGPGAVADAVMSSRLINKCEMRDITVEMETIVASAYFGGRFEQYQGGRITGPIYIYDINSAYPTMLENLPDLRGAYWEEVTDFVPGQIGIYYCTHESLDLYAPHPLPYRNRGNIHYPAQNAGVWVWSPEAELGSVMYGFVLHTVSEFRPFAFVRDLYATRQQWKAEGNGGERALKLILNSLYGKLAQTLSFGGKRPKFTEMIWAGLITSGTRRMLWDAISLNPSAVIAVETDSVITREPLPLDTGAGLGMWELEIVDEITYIQSGVYFKGKEGATARKTRGMSARLLDWDTSIAWLASGAHDHMKVVESRFVGITSGRFNKMGDWELQDKHVQFGGGKRIHTPETCPACRKGYSLAEAAHRLHTDPFAGLIESERRMIPWIDGLKAFELNADGSPRRDLPGVEAPEAVAMWTGPRDGSGRDDIGDM